MKTLASCILIVAACSCAFAQDIPAPLNVTTALAGRQEIFTLQNLNTGPLNGGGDEADMVIWAKTDTGNAYRIGALGGIVTNRANATRTGDLVFRCGPGEGMTERLRISNSGEFIFKGTVPTTVASGEVRIGGGRVMVGGILSAQEIRVTTSGADYVFEAGYHLRPLADVEQFVLREKHLPEIMTATDMQTSGMPVSGIVTKQLAKIEELTLYAIQQQKVIEEQRHDQEELRRANAVLLEHLRDTDRRIDALEAHH